MLALLREISARHWARAPFRSLLVVLGIALGVGLYVATETATESMFTAFGELVARVSGRADLTIQASGAGVPNELVSDVAEVPGVAHAGSTLEITAQAPEYRESVLVLGVDFLGDLHFLPFVVKEGEERVIEDPLAFANDPTAILISKRFATRHGLAKDSRIALLTSDGPKDFHVRGILEDSGPAASFGGQVAVMFLDAAQVAFSRGTFVDRIDVAAAPGTRIDDLARRLQQKLGSTVAIEAPEQLGVRLRKISAPLHASLWLSGFFALIVGAFLVYNAVGIAVAQRTREIGVLRALGVTRRGTIGLFALEASILAVPGVVVGLVLGRILSHYTSAGSVDAMNRLFASVADVEPRISPELALRAAFAGIFSAGFSALWPARRGAAPDPAIVLRASSVVERGRIPLVPFLAGGFLLIALSCAPLSVNNRLSGSLRVALSIVGAAFVTPSIIIVLRRILLRPVEAALGLPARLGLDYVARTLGRSTVNVLALMVAVTMSVSIGGWLTSFEHSITSWAEQVGVADLSVTQGSPILDRRHVALSAALADRIKDVGGIRRVQRIRITEQRVSTETLRLVATDTDAFIEEAAQRGRGWVMVEGRPVPPGELATARELLLSENASRKLGLHAGGRVALHTPKGDVDFAIRGVIVDYTSEEGAAIVDRKHFIELWGDDSVDGAFVYVSPGADVENVATGIRAALGGASSIFVTKTEALEEQLLVSIRKTFSFARSIELVILLIALIGVVGTMAAAVIDRTREIGLFRAIGATAKQVAGAVVVEAAFLGLSAVVAGVALGILECHLFLRTLLVADTGWHIEFVFPYAATARITALVVVTSAIAGGIPAYRASRTQVASALAVE